MKLEGKLSKCKYAGETLRKIKNLYESGMKIKDIVKETGLTYGQVQYVIRQVLMLPPRKRKCEHPTKEELEECLKKGMTHREIAEKYGVPIHIVANRIHKYGLSRGRERRTLEKVKELFRKGLSDKEIAEILDISPVTVAMYRSMLGLRRNNLMEVVMDFIKQKGLYEEFKRYYKKKVSEN